MKESPFKKTDIDSLMIDLSNIFNKHGKMFPPEILTYNFITFGVASLLKFSDDTPRAFEIIQRAVKDGVEMVKKMAQEASSKEEASPGFACDCNESI